MFTAIAVLLLAAGLIPLLLTLANRERVNFHHFVRRLKISSAVLAGVILLLVAFNIFAHLYTEYLWFSQLGYSDRYVLEIGAQAALCVIGGLIAFLFLWVNVRHSLKHRGMSAPGWIAAAVALLPALLVGAWSAGLWERLLLFLNQAPSEVSDPIFGFSMSWYLFSLPFLSAVTPVAIFLIVIAAVLVPVTAALSFQREEGAVFSMEQQRVGGQICLRQLLILVGLFALGLAWNYALSVFRLMYSSLGAVTGAGYTDVHFRILGYGVTIAALVAAAALLFVSAASPAFRRRLFGLRRAGGPGGASPFSSRTALIPAIVVGLLIVFNVALPGIATVFIVNPNEITLEAPYIEHNIRFTRRAYNIHEEMVQEERATVGRDIGREVTEANRQTLDNVRLWDARALMDNLREQQEIRLYYKFHDVDIDRYQLDGKYRQVMLAVREFDKSALPRESQTWVSRHFKYTHGYGLVLLPVHESLPEGKPKLLIRNIPPEVEPAAIELKRNGIYYGERTTDHVYVNTDQEEFDYPLGDENVYTSYQGTGGVPLSSFFRVFCYAWKFDSHRPLFTGYLKPESRLLFRRDIRRRVRTLAPFLKLDADPYAVITEDGHIKYIMDAYTVSTDYPYSEPYRGVLRDFHGYNYIRNSVKVVVDAYDGTVELYIVDESDLIIRSYKRIFPDLFKSFDEMPEDLQRHIRYPEDYLTVQAEMYSTYHMTDVQTFYQREDVWQFATERYRQHFQRVVPYYVMIHFPGEEAVEFVLIIPFTPKNKNVVNAWMAGRCDMPHYGKLRVFTFPKGVEVLGPRQIEARIDQNTEMSQAMTLWGQRGSQVIRGNLLAIPLFYRDMLYLLYAEPIYLQAEDAQLPEIKRIALADQERVVWAEEFDTSVARLLGEAPEAPTAPALPQARPDRAQEVLRYLEEYQDLMGRGEFRKAGEALEKARRILEQEPAPEEPAPPGGE